jgi:phosphotriesterase-related protein
VRNVQRDTLPQLILHQRRGPPTCTAARSNPFQNVDVVGVSFVSCFTDSQPSIQTRDGMRRKDMCMADGTPSTLYLNRREVLRLLGMTGVTAVSLGPESLAYAAAQAGQRPPAIPSGAIIRTVLSDLNPSALAGQATLMHEHLVGGFYSSPPRPAPTAAAPPPAQPGPSGGGQANPARREETPEAIELIVNELKASKVEGLGAIVDAAIYRRPDQSIEALKTIAQRSAVHVIVAGGYYRAPYPAGVIDRSEEQIVEEFVRDAATQRWGAFGEIGSALETHPDERKMMRAVAKAHLRTGLPIFTHTPHESCQKCAIEQLDIYLGAGVDPRHLCIGHLSDLKDEPAADTPKAVAKRGAWVGFDTVGHELNVSKSTLVTDQVKLKMMLAILEAGYEDQVLLSSDMAHNNHLKANWGEGFSAVLVTFVSKLKFAGVKDATIRKILHDNPRRFLAFTPKRA